MAVVLLLFIVFCVLYAFWRGWNMTADLIEKARAEISDSAEAQEATRGKVI